MRSPAFAALAAPFALAACSSPERSLRRDFEQLLAGSGDAVVAIAWKELDGGGEILLNADVPLPAPSAMQLPVMIEVYRQADLGLLRLDEALPVPTGAGTFPFARTDDPETSLWARGGERVSIGELVQLMIERGSLLATHLLLRRVTPAAVNATLERLGATRTRVRRDLEDAAAPRRGGEGVVTAGDLAQLLQAIHRGLAASTPACRQMLDLLAQQQRNDGIPRGLPPGWRVAHTAGDAGGVRHDAAIVWPPERPPYVLVVLTRGLDRDAADDLVADVARRSTEAVVGHAAAAPPRGGR